MGRVFETFRETLHLARAVRPDWFFELTPSDETAARTLDDHDVDVIVAPFVSDGSPMKMSRSHARRVAVVARCAEQVNSGHDAAIEINAPVAEQLAVLDRVLAPALRRSA